MWAAMLSYQAARNPRRPFLHDDAASHDYGEVARRVARFAHLLRERGVGTGDRVALFAHNSLRYVEAMLAASWAGAVVVPINYRLADDEVAYILDHSGAKLLLADAELTDVDVASGPELPLTERAQDDVARIMYTSGTTGRPKGVIVSNRNVEAKCAAHARDFGMGYQDRGLVAGPLFHAGALDITVTTATYVGASVIVHPRFDAEKVVAELLRGEVSQMWLAPVMLDRVLELARSKGVTLPAPRVLVGGGAATNPARYAEIHAVFPHTWYADVYGLTETVSGDTILPAGADVTKPGSVGLPCSAVEVAVFDGQIALRGPKVSPGYWRDDEATSATRAGDWFLTGDLGHLDADGFLYLDGRLKDLIISGGENVSAAEIETVLEAHDDVVEAAVVGRPDERWGEVPVAFVVTRGEVAALREHLVHRLAKFKVPREIVTVDALPRNASGKVQKHLLPGGDA